MPRSTPTSRSTASPRRRRGVALLLTLALATAIPGSVAAASASASAAGVTATVAVGSAAVAEGDHGDRILRLPVTLSTPVTAPVSVDYTVRGLTATPGIDEIDDAGTVTFAPGADGRIPVQRSIAVRVLGDVMPEADEQFRVTLSNPSPGLEIDRSVAFGTILDDDPANAPSVSVGAVQIAEGDAGTARSLRVPVTLSEPRPFPVSVIATVTSGSATAGSDFHARSSTQVRFAPGEVQHTVPVAVVPDRTPEPSESVIVWLSAPAYVVIGRAVGVSAVLDDDGGVLVPTPGLTGAVLASDLGDTVLLNGTPTAIAATASLTANASRNRVVAWPTAQATSVDETECSTWLAQSLAMPSADDQQGLAFRVATVDGVTRAVTVTKNVFFGANWIFNVHVWNTANPVPFTQVADFDLSAVIKDPASPIAPFGVRPLPWHVCGRVVGDQLQFKVWMPEAPEPAWDDPVAARAFRLPTGWRYAGHHGVYAGHLGPGDSVIETLEEPAG